VGGVRFIKWAQDTLVLIVKCDNQSNLLSGGDKRYSAFKDVLAPICSVFSIVVVNLEWHLRLRVMLEDPTSRPLRSSLTLKCMSFLSTLDRPGGGKCNGINDLETESILFSSSSVTTS
jgi:hypothetical protein